MVAHSFWFQIQLQKLAKVLLVVVHINFLKRCLFLHQLLQCLHPPIQMRNSMGVIQIWLYIAKQAVSQMVGENIGIIIVQQEKLRLYGEQLNHYLKPDRKRLLKCSLFFVLIWRLFIYNGNYLYLFGFYYIIN